MQTQARLIGRMSGSAAAVETGSEYYARLHVSLQCVGHHGDARCLWCEDISS